MFSPKPILTNNDGHFECFFFSGLKNHAYLKARELVKAAYPKGVTVNVLVIARDPDTTYGELLKAMWEAAGMKVELKTIERLEWINNLRKDNFEIGFW